MYERLIRAAFRAKKNSYSPYSNFKVGASVLGENGKVYLGCNIENSSYSPTICAERTAIFKSISEGNRKIKKIVIVSDINPTYPCGMCRQVILEFADKDTEIIVARSIKEYEIYKIDDLLPKGFGPKEFLGGN